MGRWTVSRWGTAASGSRCAARHPLTRQPAFEHVPSTAAVFCSNHESNVDPPVLVRERFIRRLHVLYKAELRKFPDHGDSFDVAGFVPVDEAIARRRCASISRGAASLRCGQFVSDLS